MKPRATLTSALTTLIAPHAYIVLTGLTLPVLAPLAADDLGIDRAYVGLFSAATFGVAAIAVLFGAAFVRRFGPIRAVQISALCGVLGVLSIASGWTPALILGALFCGLSYAPPNPASSPVLMALAPAHRRSSIFSLKQVSVPLGGAIAGAALPILAVAFGWQGAALVTAGLGLVIIIAIEPWRTPINTTIKAQAKAETVARNPMDAVRAMLADKALRAIGFMCFAFAALQYTFSAVFVVFLVARAKISTVEAGAILGAALFVSIFMRVIWGLLADRLGNAAVIIVLALGMIAVAFISVTVTSRWPLAGLTTLGICFAAVAYSWNGVYLAAVADVAGPARIADATSSTMAFVFAGGLAGPVLHAAIVAATGDLGLGFGLLGILALTGGTWAAWTLWRYPPPPVS